MTDFERNVKELQEIIGRQLNESEKLLFENGYRRGVLDETKKRIDKLTEQK